jgi:acetyltransferase-like isoleucine patch superfamily enzyme
MSFLLSICIPTFNRSTFLEKTLESITSDQFFRDHLDIEIVISDNCSTDETRNVASQFERQFPHRVRYFRNEINIADMNFDRVLRHGQGEFLKLINDSALWRAGALRCVYELVLANQKNKPVLFWLNGMKKTETERVVLAGIDAFVKHASFYMGWIGAFGLWKQELQKFSDLDKYASSQLLQVHILFCMIAYRKDVVISNHVCFKVQDIGKKGGYSLAKVFAHNYLSILNEYREHITDQTFSDEKKSVLIDHILPYHFHPKHDYVFEPLEEFLDPVYHNEPYYQAAVNEFRVKWQSSIPYSAGRTSVSSKFRQLIALFFLRLLLKLKPKHNKSRKRLWRFHNSHNMTSLVNDIDFNKVSVGRGSYGPLQIYSWGANEERLVIGSFVSIANDVRFILGGNHAIDNLFSYPFKTFVFGVENEAASKGPIVVGDDVWIGLGATILSGVKVGRGAVIGASTVVTRDIPPYAVVAGNPARIIKYRFSPQIIETLLKQDFDDLCMEDIINYPNTIHQKVNENNFQSLVSRVFPVKGNK